MGTLDHNHPLHKESDFEEIITTPHEHEGPGHMPLWIIWLIRTDHGGVQEFPAIDSVSDSENAVRYNLYAALESHRDCQVFMERIPANHRFGSSLSDELFAFNMKAKNSITKYREKYFNHRGD